MGVVQRELIGKVNGSNVADVIDEYNKRLTDEYCPVPACLAREPGWLLAAAHFRCSGGSCPP